MPSRRRVLGLLPVVLAAACSGGDGDARDAEPPSGSGGDSSRQTMRLETPLSSIDLLVTEGNASEWADRVKSAAGDVATIWGKAQGSVRVAVVDDATFAAAADGLDGSTAAVTTSDGRVLVSPSAARSLTDIGRQVVIAHELAHVRLRHFGSDRTALWLKEGAAEWTATPDQAPRLPARWPNLAAAHNARQGHFTGPPSAQQFQRDARLGYEWSAAYVTYLADVAGAPALKRLVQSRSDEEHASSSARQLLPDSAESFAAWLDRALNSGS